MPDFTDKNPEIRCGKDKVYTYAATGKPVPKRYLSLIRDLKIPAVYSRLWLSRRSNDRLRAVAIDTKGKKQYFYSDAHVTDRDSSKVRTMTRLAEAIAKFTKINNTNAKKSIPRSKLRALSFMAKLMAETNIRVGNKKYLDKNKSFGLSTLQKQHVKIRNKNLALIEFVGKHGVLQKLQTRDPETVSFLRSQLKLPTEWVFKYESSKSFIRVSAQDFNRYLQSTVGFTCKDFRTHGANMAFLKALQSIDDLSNLEKNVSLALETTASVLGNNKATSKRSYVADCIAAQYLKSPKRVRRSTLLSLLKSKN